MKRRHSLVLLGAMWLLPMGGTAQPSAEVQALLHKLPRLQTLSPDDPAAQRLLAPYCLLQIHINPEARVKVVRGAATPRLVQGQWSVFLVQVQNEAGVTAPLHVTATPRNPSATAWLEIEPNLAPLPLRDRAREGAGLTGHKWEYRVLRLRSQEAGQREATLLCKVGQEIQDFGGQSEISLMFRSQAPSPEGTPLRVEAQPLRAQLTRLAEALESMGSPLSPATRAALQRAGQQTDDQAVTQAVQRALDPYCLAHLHLQKDGSLLATQGAARPLLVEQGWRLFLLKVRNDPGYDTRLRVESPNAKPIPNAPPQEVKERWLDIALPESAPLTPTLSGLGLEYRPILLYSREAKPHTTTLRFNIGQWNLPKTAETPRPRPQIRTWRFGQGVDGWQAWNEVKLEAKGGVLQVQSTGSDPFMAAPVRATGGAMVVRFRAKAPRDDYGQLFWWTEDKPQPDGRRLQTFSFTHNGGKWSDYAIPIRVEGDLRGIRIDPGGQPGRFEFSEISLSYQDEARASWASLTLPMQTEPARRVTFRVRDEQGKPAMASFLIRDAWGRVYPLPSKRLEPDFFFHPQVYRADGETLPLPQGTYTVTCSRGPESLPETQTLRVEKKAATFAYQVKRWVDPAKRGWRSGDHHIHAAGCAHYTNPTEGVQPNAMMRHILGEDLKVGCNLTWGPCFDFQKQFFTGQEDKLSQYPYLLRYDIEVSGFGSHQSGHLCLLRLREQIYPGGTSKDHWPTLGLNTLRWAKKQGAICGPAHSASGLVGSAGRVEGQDGPDRLPNYAIPPYDGIGANEFVVDVTHEVPGPDGKQVPAVDFISTMDTDRRAELNMWYHVLNAGYRVRASGETDFPCISGERVGLGRVYVKQSGRGTYDDWCEGIREGRSYVSDGASHLMDFEAQSVSNPALRVALGEKESELRLAQPGKVQVKAVVAARLSGQTVPLEVVVNGYPVARQDIRADGREQTVTFDVEITRSSWVALRIYPSSHTNPIFVVVGDRPIRASRQSVEWCLRGVEQCWSQKARFYAPGEFEEAKAAYDHARQTYRRLLAECEAP